MAEDPAAAAGDLSRKVMNMIILISVLILLLIASFEDIRKKEVPMWELLSALVISGAKVVTDAVAETIDPAGIALSLIPGALFILLAFVTRQGIGYGDGLLLLCLGPALGLYKLVLGIIVSLFVCSIFSAILLLIKKANGRTRIPYVPFLTIGMAVMSVAQI